MVQSGFTLLGQAVQVGNVEVIKVLLNAENFFPPDENDCPTDGMDTCSLDDTLNAFLHPNEATWNHEGSEVKTNLS